MKKNYIYPTTTSTAAIITNCLSTSDSTPKGNVVTLKVANVAGD